ncbi:MAG: hypothetical protein MZV64_44740 [Ignavibacteriales bacterium]|nr:hypothetical protein [Ignavibacteriales bacterium]
MLFTFGLFMFLLVLIAAVRLQGAADRGGDRVSAMHAAHASRSVPGARTEGAAFEYLDDQARTSWSAGRASSRCSPTRSSPPAARWSSWRSARRSTTPTASAPRCRASRRASPTC